LTLAAVFDFFLSAMEQGEAREMPVPTQILSQARLAVVSNLSLDELLRRCVAVNFLLAKYLQRGVESADVSWALHREMTERLEASFDQVFDVVVREYKASAALGRETPNSRRFSVVNAVLSGASDDLTPLDYDVGLSHVGVVAKGDLAKELLARLTRAFEARALVVALPDATLWGWLGSNATWSRQLIRTTVAATMPTGFSIAFGGCDRGLAGWRVSHQEAEAAFPLALGRSATVFYEDVALESSASQDPVLSEYLRRRYLIPIIEGRADGATLIETVRTYLATGRNGVSASAALGVSRQTVTNRLRFVEETIGLPLDSCATDLDLALRLADVGG
jgi:hypothetical protein